MSGDKLLTAVNAGDDRDAALFATLGLRGMAAEPTRGVVTTKPAR